MQKKVVGRRSSRRGRTHIPTQREVLRDVMLAAGKYGAWMTLRELSKLTGYGEASISAQLRHLRQVRYGGFVVRKRVRLGEVVRQTQQFIVWEYQLARKRQPKLAAGRRDRGAGPHRVCGFAG